MTATLTGSLLEDLKHATNPELFTPLNACLTQQLAWSLSHERPYDRLYPPDLRKCVAIITEKYGDEYAAPVGDLYTASASIGDFGPEGHAQAVKIAEELFA